VWTVNLKYYYLITHNMTQKYKCFLNYCFQTLLRYKALQDWKGVISTGIHRVSTCTLYAFAFCMLLADTNNYTISYINYTSIIISIVHKSVAIHGRWCKNISISFQHMIYSLTLIYVYSYSEKKLEQIAIQFMYFPLLSLSLSLECLNVYFKHCFIFLYNSFITNWLLRLQHNIRKEGLDFVFIHIWGLTINFPEYRIYVASNSEWAITKQLRVTTCLWLCLLWWSK
jgi:hypothetical protein